MKLTFLVVVGLVACGKAKPEQASGSGSASAVVAPPKPVASIDAAPPPIDAPIVVAVDAAEPDAAVAEAKLGAPFVLSGPFKGLVVQPLEDWVPKQKSDHVAFTSPCCLQQLLIRVSPVKLTSIDDVKKHISALFPVMKEVSEIVEHHDVERGFWGVFKGPSSVFDGDIDTAVIEIVHLGGKTFACSALLDTKAGTRDIRPDELVTTCGTLRAK